jgi:hypothetical protein
MTCYDCINYNDCIKRGDVAAINLTEDSEKECDLFKNKADFVEVVKVVEMLCKIKTNIIENVSAMIENDFNKIVKDALGIRSDT